MRGKSSSLMSRHARISVLTLTLVLALGGCTQFPSLEQMGRQKQASEYQTASSLSGPVSNWPDEHWWECYADPQLDALIAEALSDSPDMAAALARLRRAEAFGQIAGAILQPQVSANVAVTDQKLSYNYLTPRTMIPDGWNDYGRATLDFNWEIDFWGKNRSGLAAATSQLEASRAELAHVRLGIAAAVATNYAELAQLFAVRDTAARSVDIRSKTAKLFSERYDNGLETKGSLSEAKARLAGVEGELLMLDEQIGLLRNRLAALLGAGPDRGLAIQRPTVKLNGDFSLPTELVANLLGRRPDVVAARLMADSQLKRIDQKKAEFYPNVNLSAFIGVQSLGLNMLNKGGSSIGSIGPALTLPIFTGGRLRGELRGTVASYDEAVANYNRTVTQALQEVASTGLSQKALSAQLAKAYAAVEAAGDAHRVARNRYEGGLANYLEVLYAEDGLLNSQRNLANLQSRAFTLDVAMKRALGGGYQSNNI
jgi:NodT family efflux transporter outer membrane factor (OMF) lipoprotein